MGAKISIVSRAMRERLAGAIASIVRMLCRRSHSLMRMTRTSRDIASSIFEVGSGCAVTGSWYSVYDGATWYDAGDVDIDHLVPLAEAWDSGAGAWSTSAREGFANDLSQPQLIAVTDNVNQEKGDQDPAEWMPPSSGFHCVYARAWVQVKYNYDLSVDSAEKSALTSILNGC